MHTNMPLTLTARMLRPTHASQKRHCSGDPKPEWFVFLRHEYGSHPIPEVLDAKETFGELPRVGFAPANWGSIVRVRVSTYKGPNRLSGMLCCVHGNTLMATFGAKLKKIEEVNIGITELTFQAECTDANSPTRRLALHLATHFFDGPMPSPNNLWPEGCWPEGRRN